MNVESVDWPNKRIYLHADTVTNGFDSIAAHFELKVLAQANANNEQNFTLPTAAEGNIPKGGGRFTPRYLFVEPSWRFVPYGQVAHGLNLLTEIVSQDELTDKDVFDRSAITVAVDIDSVYEAIEIVTSSASITAEDLEGIEVQGVPEVVAIALPLHYGVAAQPQVSGEAYVMRTAGSFRAVAANERLHAVHVNNFQTVAACCT